MTPHSSTLAWKIPWMEICDIVQEARIKTIPKKKKCKKAKWLSEEALQISVKNRDAKGKGEGSGKPLQYSCLENPMNSTKRKNDRILKEELPRSVGASCATGDQWRNNSRKNEGMEPKKNNAQLWM